MTFSWPAPVRALRHRNFRLYFFGHFISTLGTWVQQVALAWLAYRLTGSAAVLGITAFVALVPQLLLSPLVGAWIDRHDKRLLLMGVQSLMGGQALALAVLAYAEWLDAVSIVAMATLLGILSAVDTPLRQSLIGRFVDDPKDLGNALALNALLFNSSRFIGPPLAGVLLAVTSEAMCFALNAVSYLALVVGLWLVKLAPGERAKGSFGDVFREGLRYIVNQVPVRRMIVMVLMVNVTASSYAALLPVFAKDVLEGGAPLLGWLWGAAGAGSFLSAVLLAVQTHDRTLPHWIAGSVFASALGLLMFALSDVLWVSMLAMVVLGFSISTCNVGTNILLQGRAPEALRGRVVSIYSSTRFGFDAVGGLLAGLLASAIGGPWSLAGLAVVLGTYGLWWWGVSRPEAGLAHAVNGG